MATWKVSIEEITLLSHPNADSLEIVNAGDRQFVVQKGLYQTGQQVIVVPEKSLLPDDIAEPFKKYLGKDNRVKSNKLRGELSEGVLLPIPDTLTNFLTGQDVSDTLGITEYMPIIPTHLAGDMVHQKLAFVKHDCEHFRLFEDEFEPDEIVCVTEKIHGIQLNLTVTTYEGSVLNAEVTSKGLGKRAFVIKEDPDNLYWRCVHQDNLLEKIGTVYPNHLVQIIGEAIPCQKGFTYGLTTLKPRVLIYKIIVNGVQVPFWDVYNAVDDACFSLWNTVPLLYYGEFKDLKIEEHLSSDSEYQGTIREGVVISPAIPRLSKDGKCDLYLKLITDAYMKKGYTGEEFN